MTRSPIRPDAASPDAGRLTPAMRLALRCLLLLAVANSLFLVVRLADNLVPKTIVAARLRAGYADGSMTIRSYPDNMLAGRDMYSDCIAAQLAVLGGEDMVRDAVAPHLLTVEQVGSNLRQPRQYPCRNLKTYLDGHWRQTPSATYTRFWQGGASVLAMALAVMPVDAYRALLLDGTLGLIALCAVLAALAGRDLLAALAPLLAGSFLLGGQVGYGQLFSYGPPQIALWGSVAAMIAWRSRLTPDRLVLLAVLSGAVEAFVDQIISVPLVAGSFLIVAGTIGQHHGCRPRDDADASSAKQAATGVAVLALAWVVGFAGTYAAKLAISVALLGWEPAHDFLAQLAFRAGTLDPALGFDAAHASRPAMLWHNVGALAAELWRLGYAGKGNPTLGLASLAIGTAGWIAAILRRANGAREDRAPTLVAGLPYIAAATFLLLWVAALPEHTVCHAFFMVRSALLWLVGGWGWYFCARTVRSDRMGYPTT